MITRSSKKQVQTSDKNTEIKYPEGDRLFCGCDNGSIVEFSIAEKKPVYDHGQILVYNITSMAKTPDNKSQFVCASDGTLIELDIATRKQVNSFNIKDAKECAVTLDNKSLIIGPNEKNCFLTQWSIQSKKQLHTWQSGVKEIVLSQSVSYDNKYLLIGYEAGWLSIFDLKKHQTLKNTEAMPSKIFSMVFSRDNQSAFISDTGGNIKMIKWQADASSGDDFDLSEEPKMVGSMMTYSICTTKDEKYLIIGSFMLIRVLETATREVIKEFAMTGIAMTISLIQDGKKAVIVQQNGNLSILDLETLEISSIAENITKPHNGLRRMTLI